MDPYYPEYFEKFSSEEEAIRAYFAETLENLKCHDDYDVLGHLDYIVRVAPSKDKNYSYDKYKDAIDPILELLVHSGKGLELNTGSFLLWSQTASSLYRCSPPLSRTGRRDHYRWQ